MNQKESQPRAAVPQASRIPSTSAESAAENQLLPDSENVRDQNPAPPSQEDRSVAQPPSAVIFARPYSYGYRRNLPHYQGRGRPLFVTFCTFGRFILPESIRDLVLKHCLHDDGKKLQMQCAVVMPDHVHLIYFPRRDAEGDLFSLAEILNGIKGASAHLINKALGRKGSVWQDESSDHVIRNIESLEAKIEYIKQNPVRKGLSRTPELYPWLWMRQSQPGAAVPHNNQTAPST